MSTHVFARTVARELFAEHGLTGWSFGFDRATARLGECRHDRKRITVSGPLLAARTDDEVEQTIIHEVAHALTPGHGHDRVWLAQARSMGYRGKASTEATPAVLEARIAHAPLIGECGRCGVRVPRHRAPRPGAVFHHRMCGGRVVFSRNV